MPLEYIEGLDAKRRQIERKQVELMGNCHQVLCRGCKKTITLWFNGGELDTEQCCGYEYALEHGPIYFAVYEVVDLLISS